MYLVEASPILRERQKSLLCGNSSLSEAHNDLQSRSRYSEIPVTWCEDIRDVPKSTQFRILAKMQPNISSEPSNVPFIIAHEFFDALPIHAFQCVPPKQVEQQSTIQGLDGKPIAVKHTPVSSQTNQWRELLVSTTPAPPPKSIEGRPSLGTRAENPEFQLLLAKASTPASLVLPESSSRYKELKTQADSIIEVSPEGRSYAAEIARRIGGGGAFFPAKSTGQREESTPKKSPSGAALIIDYGPEATVPTSTLRGIRAHNLVSPFMSPGEVDLSADVDFTGLAEAAIEASEGVEVYGPIEQGEWLKRMGVRERAEMLIRAADSDDKKVETINRAVQRLVERGGGGMGRLYKAMAIVPEAGGKRRPVGFGGELA